MEDRYVSLFHDLAQETRRSYGFELPGDVEQYVVLLLADHVKRPDWVPNPSFAEAHLNMRTSQEAKALGDECLFLCGVFPRFGARRGLDLDYYATIGSNSYSRASRTLHAELFEDLSRHFRVISKFINHTVEQLPVFK
jgi:hypothetical protein